MSMCRVFSFVVGRGYLLCVLSWQNSIILCPASFCTPRPNLPVTPGIFWLPTFAFQSPIMKRTSFFFKGKGEGQITWGFYHCEFRYCSLWLKPLRAFGQAVTISNMYFKVVILAALWFAGTKCGSRLTIRASSVVQRGVDNSLDEGASGGSDRLLMDWLQGLRKWNIQAIPLKLLWLKPLMVSIWLNPVVSLSSFSEFDILTIHS